MAGNGADDLFKQCVQITATTSFSFAFVLWFRLFRLVNGFVRFAILWFHLGPFANLLVFVLFVLFCFFVRRGLCHVILVNWELSLDWLRKEVFKIRQIWSRKKQIVANRNTIRLTDHLCSQFALEECFLWERRLREGEAEDVSGANRKFRLEQNRKQLAYLRSLRRYNI